MIKWIGDQILARLQKRCTHAGEMVAYDVLEGGGAALHVSWCRRCGAVKVVYDGQKSISEWRQPCPNLWREKRFGLYRRASFNGDAGK